MPAALGAVGQRGFPVGVHVKKPLEPWVVFAALVALAWWWLTKRVGVPPASSGAAVSYTSVGSQLPGVDASAGVTIGGIEQ